MYDNSLLQTVVHFVVTFIFAFGFLMSGAVILVWLERKFQAFVQDRWGPLHYGPQGLIGAALDPLKLFLKEDMRATETDNVVWRLAPVIFFAPVVAAFVVLPFSPYMTVAALGTGIVYYVALSSIDVVGVFMAGWGSNNKYALIGGLRSAAQMISYELPLVLSIIPVVMLSSMVAPDCAAATPNLAACGIGSISFSQIVSAQMTPTWWLWFAIIQPLGLVVYYICGLAETNRTPFDLPEAESELVAGYLTEYSGLRWAMFFLGEYGNMSIVSAVATALFLGGWSGPGASVVFWTGLIGTFWGNVVFNIIAVFWFMVKMGGLLTVFIWIRSTLPRLRADQLMRFAWLYLIPLTLINILGTGALLLIPVSDGLRLLFAAVFNWVLMVLVVVTFRRLTGVTATGALPRWMRKTRRVSPSKRAISAPPSSGRELAGTGRR